jgi:hypothetical protein
MRSEQTEVQAVKPVGQAVRQMPRKHEAVPPVGGVQARLQPPQWARLELMLTQVPPQIVCPTGQRQTPA